MADEQIQHTHIVLKEGLKPSDRSRKTRKTDSKKKERQLGKHDAKHTKEALLVFSEGKDGSVGAKLIMGKVCKTSSDQLTAEGMARLKAWAVKESAGARLTTMVQAKEAFLKESSHMTSFFKAHPVFAQYIAFLNIRGLQMSQASLVNQGVAEFSTKTLKVYIENGKWRLQNSRGEDVGISGDTPEELEAELNRLKIF